MNSTRRSRSVGLPPSAVTKLLWLKPASTPPAKMETATEEDDPGSRVPPEILAKIFSHSISFLPAQRGHPSLQHPLRLPALVPNHVSTPHLWCHLGSNINLWPLFARRSKNSDSFIHVSNILGEYRAVAQEEFDTVFKDAAFQERIREVTFDGDPAVFTRLFDQTPIRPSHLTVSIVDERDRCRPRTSCPRRSYSLSRKARDRRPRPQLELVRQHTESHPSFHDHLQDTFSLR